MSRYRRKAHRRPVRVRPQPQIRRRVSVEDRHRIVSLSRDAGWAVGRISRHVGFSTKVIRYHLQRYAETGQVDDRPRSGRPSVTTERDDRVIAAAARVDPFLSVRRLQHRLEDATGRGYSLDTVRNRLAEDNRSAFRPLRFPRLTQLHKVNRLRWARNHSNWNMRQWRPVLFSDESKFNISMSDGRLRVWRRRGEDLRHSQEAVLHTDAFGGGGVMVWGGIWHGGKSELVVIQNGRLNARRYIDEIVEPVIIPLRQRIGPRRFLLQQDGATAHTAGIVRDHLQDNNIRVLDWTSKMPDMSPIEHVWDMIGQKIYRHDELPPRNIANLTERIINIWNGLDQRKIDNLIESMPRRCRALIESNGGATGY